MIYGVHTLVKIRVILDLIHPGLSPVKRLVDHLVPDILFMFKLLLSLLYLLFARLWLLSLRQYAGLHHYFNFILLSYS